MKSKGHRGFTLVEVMISLAIAGLLTTGLVASLSLLLTQSPKSSAKLAVENRHELARYWLTRDANSAEDFTPGVSPTYGTFTWRDFSGETTNTYIVRYLYDSTIKALMREEKKNNVVQSTDQVAADILLVGDVTFTWNPGQRKVTVAITPTIQDAPAVGDISRTATLVAWLRFESEVSAPLPAITPVPTPIPGSVTYNVAANPTLLAGSLVSGNAASLNTADTNFYIVDSSVGSPKEIVYEVFSQTMTSPSTIAQVQVRWIGKVDKQPISMEFFVKTSGGASYSAIPDSSFTFNAPEVEETHFFFLSPAQITAVNTSEVVFLKVRAVGQATFRLSSNQIIFVASP